MSEERLQRILARAGLGSRRACERLISQGHLTVDGRPVTELGATADPLVSVICVDGQPIRPERSRYIVLHKPAGYLSNPDPRAVHPSWLDLVSVPERLFPVGRLDLDSEGLLLLTNDGDLAQHLTHPRFEHPKTYLVQVEGIPNPRKLRRMQHGIMLEDGPTAPAEVKLLRELPKQVGVRNMAERGTSSGSRTTESSRRAPKASCWLSVSLREGRKRQLRRMVARLGHPALRVVRISIGPLELGPLPVGKWRELWPAEVETLRAAVNLGDPTAAVGMGNSPASEPPAATRIGLPHAQRLLFRKDRQEKRKPLPQADRARNRILQHPPRIIAIDGPSASGKSTVGRLLARQLGYLYFDTGVMYRAVAYVALGRRIPLADEAAISAVARQVVLEVLPPTVSDGRDATVLVDGVDVTWEVRSPEVERAVSPVSSYAGVREALGLAQRRVAMGGLVVMVGRDIGTVVLPEADLKIYLDASLTVRAQRRYLERCTRGETSSLEDVLADMRRRDEIDSSRTHAPLAAAFDSIVIDTTDLGIEQVVERIQGLLGKRRRSNG